MSVQAALLRLSIAPVQTSLDCVLQGRHALSFDRADGSFGLTKDRLTKTKLIQGRRTVSRKDWAVSSWYTQVIRW